ncbi:hypothetical protein [Segniliparus rugosus]|nr:hypothetical protein [Segniliparus rugosus]
MSQFPEALHRTVRQWCVWREIYLRHTGRRIGLLSSDPESFDYWYAWPPKMATPTELRLGLASNENSYLVAEDGCFYLESEERGSRGRDMTFTNFPDAEKAVLFSLADVARSVNNLDSLDLLWYREGLHPRVTLTNLEPEKEFSQKFGIIVDQEPAYRGWMTQSGATVFSHVVVLTYEELDARLREGVPPGWFTLELVES